jgi:hypothetical protein
MLRNGFYEENLPVDFYLFMFLQIKQHVCVLVKRQGFL